MYVCVFTQIFSNLAAQFIPITLGEGWEGSVVAYKTGNVVTIYISKVKNELAMEPLAYLPDELIPEIDVDSVVMDATDNESLKRITITRNINRLYICWFNWEGWYVPGHTYYGSIVYIV